VVVFTATVSTAATGTVIFSDGGSVIGTASITGGIATVSTSTLTSGAHTITAAYGGDTTYDAATSAPLIQTVGKNTPTLPPPSVSNPTQTYGGTETITETVPTGVSGPVTFYSGTTVIGTAPVVNGVATITVTNLPIGTNSITASTPGDANNNPATSPATVVTIVPGATTVTLTTSANPASFSQAITFTATVPSAATGTMTFLDGTSVLGTGAINGGVATLTTSTLAIGTHAITASYGGDTTYKSAVSAPLAQVIGKLPTTITLSISSGTSLITNSVTLTAVVAASAPTPTGSVTFMEGTNVLGTAAMSTNGGVVGLQLSGNAALALSTLTSGSHTITAVYSGDASFLTSTSAPVATIIQDFTNKNTGNASTEVYPGDSATYKFTLAPVGATTFLSNVSVAVTGLPDGATYTITPSSVAAGAGSTELTLTVTTSKALKTSSSRSTPFPGQGSPVAFGLLGLVGLGALRRYRRKMPKLLVVILLLAGSLLPVASLTGCAGGYFAPTPSSYTVTVTGTEGTVQRAATAALIVQQ
jgi:MYXO-CTERM domain-containing protein